MDLQLILNDLSLAEGAEDRFQACASMSQFVQTMVRAARLGVKSVLRVPMDFESKTLCPGYPLVAWRNDPQVEREQKQYFNSVVSKVSYLEGLPDIEQQLLSIEYEHQGVPAKGLGVASALGGLAVSIRFGDSWDVPNIGLTRNWIEIDGNGEILSSTESVYHASNIQHVETHRHWIRDRVQSGAKDGPDIWERRLELLGGLEFCPCVEPALRSLGATHVMLDPVYKRLKELDDYARNWTVGPFDSTQLSNATPESQSRLDEHRDALTFQCLDGQSRLFSWHVSMTPGEWRLHFYPDGIRGQIIIGRIGRKPGI